MDYIAPLDDGSKHKVLSHHGIKGQKWGVRRFQNPDGSLTDEGRKRYLKDYSFKNGEKGVDLSKAGNKAVSKYLKKNPGNYKSALIDNEWENTFGTEKFTKEALTKYGNLISTGKIFTKEFSDMSALVNESSKAYFDRESAARLSELRRNQREYGKQLNSGKADSVRKQSKEDCVSSFEAARIQESSWAKSKGLHSAEDVAKYMYKAVKNWNEVDPDHIVWQHMDEEYDMLDRGYITKAAFDKMYDAHCWDEAFDFANYMPMEWTEKYYNMR